MTDEAYSKQVVDQYLAGLFEVIGSMTRTLAETRIAGGLVTRDGEVEMFQALSALTKNAAAKGFYDAMTEQTRRPEQLSAYPTPVFTVIEGGRDE